MPNGNLVRPFSTKSNIDTLSNLQKICMRMITFLHYLANTKPLLYKLNILKTSSAFEFKKKKLVYDFKSEQLPIALNSLFCYSNSIHTHLSSGNINNNFYIQSGNTTRFGICSLKFNCLSLWNQYLTDLNLRSVRTSKN